MLSAVTGCGFSRAGNLRNLWKFKTLLSSCDLSSSAKQRAWSRNRYLAFFAVLLLVSLGTGLLFAQDARVEGTRVQSAVVEDYKQAGQQYREHFTSFFDSNSPLTNPNLLSHPAGYSLLWALILGLDGGDQAMQVLQIFCDAATALVLFLIASELLPRPVAATATLLVGLAPQFSWNSVILLPDTIAVLPILLAIYCLIFAAKRQRVDAALATGALIGVSCWLRPNALLLAPFCCLFVPFLLEPGRRLRFAAAILFGAVLVIAPLTIRNAIVFRHFVPLSLGAGQTMLEGIGDYDLTKRFGVPNTDIEIMSEEAEAFGKPEYRSTLFGTDGIARERIRLARAFAVIRAHPFWFAEVMSRRAASMLRLERTPIIALDPPVFHSLHNTNAALSSLSPQDLMMHGTVAASAKTRLSVIPPALELTSDDTKYGIQFTVSLGKVWRNTEYVLAVPITVRRGRVIIDVVSVDQRRRYMRGFAEAVQGTRPEEQETNTLQLPFVPRASEDVWMQVSNGGSDSTHSAAEVGTLEVFELGPASQVWSRIPRFILRSVQKLFVTALALPLMLVGLVALMRARCGRTLVILLLVPAYYLCVQSVIHTEYRYVLALHYFLFILVSTGIWSLQSQAMGLWTRRGRRTPEAPRIPSRSPTVREGSVLSPRSSGSKTKPLLTGGLLLGLPRETTIFVSSAHHLSCLRE